VVATDRALAARRERLAVRRGCDRQGNDEGGLPWWRSAVGSRSAGVAEGRARSAVVPAGGRVEDWWAGNLKKCV